MGVIIKMPMLNVNDESAVLVRWLQPEGASVAKDQAICIVETTKSAVDVCAEAGGFLRHLATENGSYAIGYPMAFIAETADEELPQLDMLAAPVAVDSEVGAPTRWTKKAEILASRLGVDLRALAAANPAVVIGEAMVTAASGKKAQAREGKSGTVVMAPLAGSPGDTRQRVLILGGGGGAALVLDILSEQSSQYAIGILDNNPELMGTELMGVPILGGFDVAVELWREKKFDALISTVVRDVADRAAIFDRFRGLGIPFANVISSAASVRRDAHLGQGNLIVHGCYVATGVVLGDNNFLAAGTFIEHHSIIGSHCTFGPRTSLSGKVKVADCVKFGTQVAVEPFVEIGSESMIASGVVLTSHVPGRSVVKNSASPIVRPKK